MNEEYDENRESWTSFQFRKKISEGVDTAVKDGEREKATVLESVLELYKPVQKSIAKQIASEDKLWKDFNRQPNVVWMLRDYLDKEITETNRLIRAGHYTLRGADKELEVLTARLDVLNKVNEKINQLLRETRQEA